MSKKTIVAGLILSVAATSLLVTAPAFAAGFGNHGMMGDHAERPAFETLDTDGDGKISVAEMRAHQSAKFGELDSDGDGSVSADEMAEMAAEHASERSRTMFERMIEWQDTDGDGKLSEAELGGMSGRGMFMRLDTDGDGSVSAEEYEKAGKDGRRFGSGKMGGKFGGERGHGQGHGKWQYGGHGKGGHGGGSRMGGQQPSND